ncbi:glycerate kinase [Jeotgalibacillus haloalkalitolerans]|uniref:Glycerate kinase n=1 Tax=Jeotgalibacillus haloalkalitolerans TaxID=3104292 RepID=A0ABU5KI16_9BACL|nr:glycerate kinase [Jeotgalibacillus sp. HH7-29]MDZ5710868.1 glycerate kinase [Jeotgalibacillus sp. HH7-29]
MKIVIAPDSFKGSLSASEAALAMKEGFQLVYPEADYVLLPMADGGEGMLEPFSFKKGIIPMEVTVKNTYGHDKKAKICIDGDTAYIESAQAVGLPDFTTDELIPIQSTSYGVGELIRYALDHGCKKVLIGLGGSAVNDGGAGLLEALGAMYTYTETFEGSVNLGRLPYIQRVDLTTLDPRLKEIDLMIASDVNNPLTGEEGATAIFGPQKGVRSEDIAVYDQWISQFAALTAAELIDAPGAGAAGGMGFALLAAGGQFAQGAKLIGEEMGLPEAVRRADLILTGEGKSDEQTMYGKVAHYVAELAASCDKPVLLISGSLDHEAEGLLDLFTASFSIMHSPCTLDYALTQAKTLTAKRATEIAKLIQLRLA